MVTAEEYIGELESQLEHTQSQNQQLQQHYATTIFNEEENENLIKFQLDIKEELSRIERLLRKQIPVKDDKGNETWKDCPENQIFNEVGINEILNLLAWYLNKNIILSNFSLEEINMRMKQLHKRLTNFVYENAIRFGMVTKDKIRHYPMVVMNIVNTIEAAYMRALNGGERESLRTARTVTQSDQLNQQLKYPTIKQQKKFSLLHPSTWVKS